MAAKLYFNNFIPAFSNNGVAIGNARLYFYLTGTEILAPIYADAALTVPLANPVAANTAGKYPDIYLDETVVYRVLQTTAAGEHIGDDIDPYIPGTVNVQDVTIVGGGGGGVPEAPNNGNSYVRKNLGWALESTSGGGVPEAPINGTAYVRKDAGWIPEASGGGGGDGVSPAYLQEGTAGEQPLVAAGVGDDKSISAAYDLMYSDIIRLWWQTPQNRWWGMIGGQLIDNSRPWLWAQAQLQIILYNAAKAGNTDAATKIAQAWTENKNFYTVAVLGQATPANGIGASDDAGHNLLNLIQGHEITNDSQLLSAATNLLNNTRTVFQNPHVPSRPTYGLLYATDAGSASVGHYRVCSTFESQIALAALYLADRGIAVSDYRDYAAHTFSWIRQYLTHSTGVCYIELDVDPTSPTVGQPFQKDYPIRRAVSPCTLQGTMSLCILAQKLYALDPDPAYLTAINEMMAGMLRYDTFLRPGKVFIAIRDGWTEGKDFPDFVRYVLPQAGLDANLVLEMKQVIVNTALQAARQRTPAYYTNKLQFFGEGYYGADWAGSEDGAFGTQTWREYGNVVEPSIGKPEQMMTTGQTGCVIAAAKLITDVTGSTQLVTYSDLLYRLNNLHWVAAQQSRGYFWGGLKAGGDIYRDDLFYLGKFGTSPIVNFDNGDAFRYNRPSDTHEFLIGGNVVSGINVNGFATTGGVSAQGQVFAATGTDLNQWFGAITPGSTSRYLSFDNGDAIYFERSNNTYQVLVAAVPKLTIDVNGIQSPRVRVDNTFFMETAAGNPVLGLDANDYISYSRTNNKFGFVIGGIVVATIDASGNMVIKGNLSQGFASPVFP